MKHCNACFCLQCSQVYSFKTVSGKQTWNTTNCDCNLKSTKTDTGHFRNEILSFVLVSHLAYEFPVHQDICIYFLSELYVILFGEFSWQSLLGNWKKIVNFLSPFSKNPLCKLSTIFVKINHSKVALSLKASTKLYDASAGIIMI